MSSHQERMAELRAELEAVQDYRVRAWRHLHENAPADERAALYRRLIARGPGSVADKAKRAGEALKHPGAKGPDAPPAPHPARH